MSNSRKFERVRNRCYSNSPQWQLTASDTCRLSSDLDSQIRIACMQTQSLFMPNPNQPVAASRPAKAGSASSRVRSRNNPGTNLRRYSSNANLIRNPLLARRHSRRSTQNENPRRPTNDCTKDANTLRLDPLTPEEHIRLWVRRTRSPSLLTTFDGLKVRRASVPHPSCRPAR